MREIAQTYFPNQKRRLIAEMDKARRAHRNGVAHRRKAVAG